MNFILFSSKWFALFRLYLDRHTTVNCNVCSQVPGLWPISRHQCPTPVSPVSPATQSVSRAIDVALLVPTPDLLHIFPERRLLCPIGELTIISRCLPQFQIIHTLITIALPAGTLQSVAELSSGAAPFYIFPLYSLKPSTNCRNEVGLYCSKLSSST